MKHLFPRLFLASCFGLAALIVAEMWTSWYNSQIYYSRAKRHSTNCHVSDPLIPFSLASNSECLMWNWDGDFHTLAKVNSLGYRSPEFTIEKPSGKKRILVVGDSMTFGLGVNDHETFSYQLEHMLASTASSSAEVINAGYASGYSVDSYYIYLKERGLKLKPDLVIFPIFVWNDIADLSETVWEKTDSEGLPLIVRSCCRVVDDGIFQFKEKEWKFRIPVLRESQFFVLLMDKLRYEYKVVPPASRPVLKQDGKQGCVLTPDCAYLFTEEEEKLYRMVKKSEEIITHAGAKVFVLLLPVDLQIYPDVYKKYGATYMPKPEDPTYIQKKLTERFNALKIPMFDVYGDFVNQKDRGFPYFPTDAHFNALGHKITAEALTRIITTNNLLH